MRTSALEFSHLFTHGQGHCGNERSCNKRPILAISGIRTLQRGVALEIQLAILLRKTPAEVSGWLTGANRRSGPRARVSLEHHF
jgi:hypothetical protein